MQRSLGAIGRAARCLAWVGLSAGVLTGCAQKPPRPGPVARPRAEVKGISVRVEPPKAVETNSADCQQGEAALMQSLPAALVRASEKALANEGFTVVTAPGQSPVLTARLDASLAYCSNNQAHIATGETGLSLVDGTRVIARATQSGDLASPLDGILARVVSELVHAPPVIDYSKAQSTR